MSVEHTWLRLCCAALWLALPAAGQEQDSGENLETATELQLQMSAPADAGLSLGVDLPQPRAYLKDRIDECMELLDGGRRLDALERINAIQEDYPANRQVMMTKSVILMKNYKFREAADLLELLIERYPDDVALLNNAAWLYATADEPGVRSGEKAVDLGKKALLSAPLNYHIWSTVSEGYYISGNFEKALHAAQEAMRLAARTNADSENLREYRTQIIKNMKALQTFSLVD